MDSESNVLIRGHANCAAPYVCTPCSKWCGKPSCLSSTQPCDKCAGVGSVPWDDSVLQVQRSRFEAYWKADRQKYESDTKCLMSGHYTAKVQREWETWQMAVFGTIRDRSYIR